MKTTGEEKLAEERSRLLVRPEDAKAAFAAVSSDFVVASASLFVKGWLRLLGRQSRDHLLLSV